MHLKRNKIGKFWTIPRKGTKYLAVSTHNKHSAVPLVVVARDILKIVKNKKELKRLLNEKQILINYKQIKETNFPIGLFDVFSLPLAKKNYQAILSENKKIIFKEVTDKESEKRIFKVMSKKVLSNQKIQMNLSNGKNILSKEKVNTGDSVLLNLKNNKIEKIIPMEKGKNAFVIQGKHAGSAGKIEEISQIGDKKIAKLSFKNSKINVWIKNLIVIE
ncbi:MAG: hypothetical protein WC438_01225 [Candidatus Pacearchaeota archaeon]